MPPNVPFPKKIKLFLKINDNCDETFTSMIFYKRGDFVIVGNANYK